MRITPHRLNWFGCKKRRRVVGEVLEDRGAHFYLAAAFCNALSHLKGGKLCQFLLLVEEQLSGTSDELCALFDRACCPGNEGTIGLGQGIHHLLIGVLREGLESFSSGRIDAAIW